MTESTSISSGAFTDVVGEVDGETEVSVVMPCLNEADTLATCIRKAQSALDAERDRRGDHRRGQRQHRRLAGDRRGTGCACRAGRGQGLRQRADGRDRRRPWPVRHHGRRRRQLRLSRAAQVRRRSCARVTTSSRAAGWSAAAARCCRARCRCCTAGWAIRCSPRWPGSGSRRRSTTSTAGCAGSRRSTTSRSTSAAPAWSSRRR